MPLFASTTPKKKQSSRFEYLKKNLYLKNNQGQTVQKIPSFDLEEKYFKEKKRRKKKSLTASRAR